MVGMMAASKAGHDKLQVYVIVKEEGDFVYLSDGRLKPIAKPKKKSKKHIQIIKHQVNEELASRLVSGVRVYDEEIKLAIKLWNRKNKEEDNV
ncbi:MAG: hypothetical protein IJW63_11510 [Lachnospiraceae bacterium]|nr:hypothetical protein [Lachnospiraceae bacterium]